MWVPFKMSTSGRAAGVLGAGDGVDGVAAGAVEAAGGVALVDAAGEATGADVGAGDVTPDDAALAGGDVEAFDPDGVALGET